MAYTGPMNNNENTATHAHMTFDGSDCDGRTTDKRVWFASEAAVPEGMTFAGFVRDTYAEIDDPEVQTLTEKPYGFEFFEYTEEGYRCVEVEFCSDDCEDERSYRDYRAESMGY